MADPEKPKSDWNLYSRHDEVAKSIQATALLLLSVGAYSLITLSTSYKTILEENDRVRLPILDASVPVEHFLVAAPILLLVLFLHVHLLLNHKRSLERRLLQEATASGCGRASEDLLYPAFFHLRSPLAQLASAVVLFLFFPALLVAFLIDVWLYETRLFLIVLAVVMLGLTLALAQAIDSLRRSWSRSDRDGGEERREPGSSSQLGPFVVSFAVVIIAMITVALVRGRPARARDLSGVQLPGRNLYGRDFTGYDFSHALFSGADLRRASLGRACLASAKLDDAQLNDANLRGSSLVEAFASCADLTGARLEGADATRATLRGARLREARARRIQANGVRFGLASDLNGIDLIGGSLMGVELPQAKLVLANLRSDFSWSCLVEADFTRTDLVGAKLRSTDLRQACFERASMDEAVLIQATLQGADLTGASMRKARLHGANLIGASLRDADLRSAALNGIEPGGFDWASHAYGGGQGLAYPEEPPPGTIGPAIVEGAQFDGALLDCADLAGVDLRKAVGLTKKQLASAVGNELTSVPDAIPVEELRAAWRSRIASCRHSSLDPIESRPAVRWPSERACSDVKSIKSSWGGRCEGSEPPDAIDYEYRWCGVRSRPRASRGGSNPENP
jgi:uncharacterized protein YjbI with pentapeptide repeats